MKKILVWNTFPLQNTGGPSGYNYNIREYVRKHPEIQISFLTDVVKEPIYTNPSPDSKSHLFTGRLSGAIRRLNILRNFVNRSYKAPFEGIPDDFDINEYDIVHLHFSMHVNRFRSTFPGFKGKLVVTSHQPSSTVDEYLTETPYKYLKLFRRWALHNEAKSYDGADFIMFPCVEAREPYEKVPQLKAAFLRNNDKFIYVPSAVEDIRVIHQAMQKLSDFGIPEKAFVITFFGRHNLVKGYDILQKTLTPLLEKYRNLYVLCAGKGDLSPVSHERWIELGFVNNVVELLEQSNLYILPNRDTYFDLVVLEVLRSATPLIMSSTGGNKYFQSLSQPEKTGLDFFDIDNLEELTSVIEKKIGLYFSDPEAYKQMGDSNRKLFEAKFTVGRFVAQYLQTLENLA